MNEMKNLIHCKQFYFVKYPIVEIQCTHFTFLRIKQIVLVLNILRFHFRFIFTM